jgi:hypothetical protein
VLLLLLLGAAEALVVQCGALKGEHFSSRSVQELKSEGSAEAAAGRVGPRTAERERESVGFWVEGVCSSKQRQQAA